MDITIGKTGQTVPVDVDRFDPATMEYVVRYGLTQCLNDAHSAVTAKAEPDQDKRLAAVAAMVAKKLDALYTGQIRVAGVGRTSDPVMSEAIHIAEGIVKKAIRASGKKLSAYDAAAIRGAAKSYIDKHPDVMDLARANVAQAAEAGPVLNLGDLGL